MKHTYMTLAIIAALSLTACGGSDDKDMVKDKDTSTGSTQDHNQDQDKDKNKDKDQGNKGSAGSSAGTSSAQEPRKKLRPKIVVPPTPKGLTADEVKLPVGKPTELEKRNKPEGDGTIVVQWGSKFKAMHSVNPNLFDKNDNDYTRYNEDGTRKDWTTSWNKISFTTPSTIVGHDGAAENLKTTGVKLGNNGSNYLAPQVVKEATLNLLAAQQSPQTLRIHLDNGKEAMIRYQAAVLNLGHQDGDYVAQAVHVFGSELTESGKENLLDMSYVYGIKTPDKFEGTENLPMEKVTYEGIASYVKHGMPQIHAGTASFDVKFPSAKKAEVSNGKIEIPSAGINYTFTEEYKMYSTSFENKNSAPANAKTGRFGNGGEFINRSANAKDFRLRGRFYGKNAQYLGGTFYNNEGAGTFFTGDKERDGEVNAQGRR